MKFYKDATHDGQLDMAATIEISRTVVNDKHCLSLIKEVYHLWFAAIDANADGIVQEEEFVHFFNILDIDSDTAKVAFHSIDSNHDGLVSLDECITRGIDYAISQDESTCSKLVWGPLVD